MTAPGGGAAARGKVGTEAPTRAGHNGGPAMNPGSAWRRHCWTVAREALLPTLPVEVVRLRLRRARELGLDYRTYAGVRATTGHDVLALLFSSNALDLLRPGDRLPAGRARKLCALTGVATAVAVHPPLVPEAVAGTIARDAPRPAAAARAPGLASTRAATRAVLAGLAAGAGAPADRVVLIGATAIEREWVAAARLAGYVAAQGYFGPPSP